LELRQRDEAAVSLKPLTAAEKQASAKAEYDRLLTMRSGGTYIPPARLRALQDQITDKTSKEFQRMAWEALKKSINGLINKVNVSNIKHIVPELFNENLVRGRGLFCRSIMKAQAASLPFTPIYAAMAAIVNTKLPQVGELLVNRLVMQFRKAFKRNDKSVCHSSTTFLAHLINQQVVHEMIAAQILLLLLHKPTDDSVEIAVGLMKEVGQHIEEMNSQIALLVYDQFRSILHEAEIDKRTQYMIEVLFQVRKDKYKDNPAIKEELDLVEEEDQITHRPGLDEDLPIEDGVNIFKVDPEYEANEEAYRKLKAEILGEESGSEDEDGDDDSDASSDDDEEAVAEKAVEIKDQSNTDLVNLRRSIYLTIMSSGQFEEACHKLMRINLPSGREEELPSMIIECCSQERTYNKFFGLIGERFCKLNRLWQDLFQDMFCKYYDTIHRYETNRLRIIAQFFGHLFSSDAIGWHVFNVVHINEEETTSSSRIFVKILFEDLASGVGMPGLRDRFKDDALQPALAGLFPTDNPINTRFSINFFTAIGMGMLTEGMREWLANRPKPAPVALPPARERSRSRSRSDSVSSYSSYFSGSSRSRSLSRTPPRRDRRRSGTSPDGRGRSITRSRSPPRRRRSPSYDSRSPSPNRDKRPADASQSPVQRRDRSLSDDSRSPPPRRARSASYDSRSPPPRRARASVSVSRSPPRKSTASRRYSDSRSPPAKRRARSASSSDRSRSPPPRDRRRQDSRSPPLRRRSLSRDSASPVPPSRSKRSPLPSRKRARSTSSSYDSRSRSRTPPRRRRSPIAKRRRDSSSPPPRRNGSRDAPAGSSVLKDANKPAPPKADAADDLSHIHPSRRGLVGPEGGPRRRAQASDFM
jgi:pre-mRNA-splicing factor CWC22